MKKTAHAPSVQLTEVPRTTITGGIEDDEAALDDLDEDMNKDSRSTQRRWDKRKARDDEFEDSEDEEESRRNGVSAQPDRRKRRNISADRPSNVTSDVDMMNSGVATPDEEAELAAVMKEAAQANAEVNDQVMEQKSRSLTAVAPAEAGPSNAPSRSHSVKPVDTEGDVGMSEAPAIEQAAAVPLSPVSSVPAPPAAVAPVAQDITEVKQEGEAERTVEGVAGGISMGAQVSQQ